VFETLKIKLFGQQPVAKITDNLLDRLIKRDFKHSAEIVSSKLKELTSDSQKGKNRISADILKLANKDINALDELIKKANIDGRDIIAWAEYPRNAKIGFDDLSEDKMKQIYIDDFVDYSNWLNEKH
jgi:hypothetical protein